MCVRTEVTEWAALTGLTELRELTGDAKFGDFCEKLASSRFHVVSEVDPVPKLL